MMNDIHFKGVQVKRLQFKDSQIQNSQLDNIPARSFGDDSGDISALASSEIDRVSGGRLLPMPLQIGATSSHFTARTVMEPSLGRAGRFYREHF